MGTRAAGEDHAILLQPGQIGVVYYLQAFVLDPIAPQWFSQSNLMAKHVGL